MQIRIVQSLKELAPTDWDALTPDHYPFTKHAYLYGLEQYDCLIPFGWSPHYFILEIDQQLVAAVPCYIKSNSYGELVFDHSWADAYQRSGLDYYPKLVTAIPYTPATGPRLLVHPTQYEQREHYHQLLIKHIIEFCQQFKLSSWHLLFLTENTAQYLQSQSFSTRNDCQFHWTNHNYTDFDDFLQSLSSRKRKNIKKERKVLANYQLTVKQRCASELTEAELIQVHKLYASIFERKNGTDTLSQAFFVALGKNLGSQTLVFSAHNSDDEIVAISLLFCSDTTLYGRVWGCSQHYEHLHFELCYYQGIDYCIKHKLQTFDPGAQGQHKISRGFLPTKTTSAHWVAHEEFNRLIQRFTEDEKKLIHQHCEELSKSSPYKKTA